MKDGTRQLKVFCGTAHKELAAKICQSMGVTPGRAKIEAFPDGETLVRIEDDVRGRDCFIIQPTCPPVNQNLMELLIFIDCLRRASAQRITAVLPYFGYARQDRKSEGRTPISAKLVANLLTTAGAGRVLAIDLHAEQVQGFFDIPVDNLTAEPVIAEYFRTLNLPNQVLVSADVGNVKKTNVYAQDLNVDLAVIDKRRVNGSEAEAVRIIGDVKDKNVLIFDDMITTAGTICAAVRLVRQFGAKSVRVGATHGVLVAPAFERLAQAPVDELVITDTLPLGDKVARLNNVTVLSIANLLGEAIHRIHENKSVSAIFTKRQKTAPA
ncbi:MAG: ribose-phosphate pyrophosphokinase [Sedimentisphaerales bacterium]|nr:ribose-phosphate pyrophosphokinase [Sedimentisphaerales bacterium]